ncbi:hypothetical protein BHM03_00061663 [Ensete ventricosum]|nr:hypothetical protein BHM03_00061663 [Ensete ventricosum]
MPLLEPEVSVALEQRLRFAEFLKKLQCSHRSTIVADALPEENDGFTIEDASHNQASPSNATLSSPSQPRSILPLLPNRSNISSRPLTTVAINSTITDHIHSRRSTPLMNLGIRVWHFDSDICQVLSSKIVYGFLLPVFGCYLCYLCSGDDLELSGVVLKLPIFISLSKGDSIIRFLLAGTSHCSKL